MTRPSDGLVGHVVRAGDADPAAGVVDHRGEQLEVVVVVEAGPARQDLGVDELRLGARPDRRGVQRQQLIGLAVPVGDEHGVELADGRPGQPDHQLVPVQASS